LNRGVAAPDYVSNTIAEQPRRGLPLPAPTGWATDRVAEVGGTVPVGPALGIPGPDQGFGLKLANTFHDQLVLAPGELAEDAIRGCLGVALKRAAAFGRAPVIHDLDIAFRIWGYLGDAPAELVALRKPLFEQCSHHYPEQRAIADSVPESTLRLSHHEVARRFPGEWSALLGR
jgi:hypothetical protein